MPSWCVGKYVFLQKKVLPLKPFQYHDSNSSYAFSLSGRFIRLKLAYLNPGLCEPYLQSQVLPCEDVRVVHGCECLLQLLQLLKGKGGSIAALLTT